MSTLRQDLIRNAVGFLSDPKIQSSPFAQRIAFLESKGLTNAEIEEAMKQAAVSQPSAISSGPHPAPYVYAPVVQPPPVPHRDWRDYFIMAVVSGGVMLGVVSLARKYLLPHLQPPTSTAYEADRDQLNAQFDAAEALLKEIQAETKAVRDAVEQQKERVDKATEDVELAVKEMRDGESKARDEMREIRAEVDNIRDMLPKMMEKNKEAQSATMAELQQELKSLKALLLSRRPDIPGTPSGVATTPSLIGRPSIPAWQLASSEPSNPVPSTNGRAADAESET